MAPAVRDGLFGKGKPDEDFQQLPLPIVNFIRGAVLRQRPHCPGIIFPVKQLPDSGHDLLIRGTNSIFFQKITHGLAQPRSKTAQRFHGRPAAPFSMRESIFRVISSPQSARWDNPASSRVKRSFSPSSIVALRSFLWLNGLYHTFPRFSTVTKISFAIFPNFVYNNHSIS